MSNEPPLDRFTGTDEILADMRDALRQLVNERGVAENPDNRADVGTLYRDVPIPSDGGLYGVPAGTTTFNFEKGEVRNSDHGKLSDVETFDSVVQGVEGTAFDTFRSLYVYADAPCTLAVGPEGRRGQFTLTQGSFYPLHEHRFLQFQVESDIPVGLAADASTRSVAFSDSDSVTGYMNRFGSNSFPNASGSYDETKVVSMYPPALEDTLGTSTAQTEAEKRVFIAGVTRTSLQVENTGSNALDARLQVADVDKALDNNSLWYDVGAETTGLSAGDHTVFDLAQRHRWLRVQVKANAGPADIGARVTLHGGFD